MVLLLLLACSDGPGPNDTDSVGEKPFIPKPTVTMTTADTIFDPTYNTEVTFDLAQTDVDVFSIVVRDAKGSVVRALLAGRDWADSVAWDGRDNDGMVVPPGMYEAHAEVLSDKIPAVITASAPIEVIRIGITAGTLGGDRIPLMWHAAGGTGMYWDDGGNGGTFLLDDLDTNGEATPIPEPWADLYAPPLDPEGENLPAAYVYNALPTLTLAVDGEIGEHDVTPSIEGWTLSAGVIAPGETVVFTADHPLLTAPGVYEASLPLKWMSGDIDLGTQDVPVRIYGLLDTPAFEKLGSPYLPWVAVIDPALRAITGVEPTETAVISALLEHIYYDMGLAYDTDFGASAYVAYGKAGFNDAMFDLSSFLDLSLGSIVNCTDCAAILEAYSNMLGAELSYTIINPPFQLNYIKAIGGDEFTDCPFGPGGCGFSYHAVTTPDGGATIFDATLALDGDADPRNLPSVDLLVQAISGSEYLDRLVESGTVDYRYTQKGSIQ